MPKSSKMHICLILTIHCFLSAIKAGPSSKLFFNDCNEDENIQETRTLDQIYKAALAEGGKLLLYAGGDVSSQQTAVKSGFEAAFPNMTLDIVVDYSKFHDARIDWQLANGKLQPDVVTLQTIQDFPRWKAGGRLLQYKPANFSKIHREFRDEDGFYVGFMVLAFGYLSNANLLAASDFPRVATDYLKPIFKGGKLAVTYPNDDDAVLFWFKQTIDKYGWQWMDKFVGQQPIYVRGTNVPRDLMANNTAAASMTTGSDAKAYVGNGTSALRFTLPSNKDPFTVWAQTGAIFKSAKHPPEAAKLFLNWMLMKETYLTMGRIWPVRMDVAPAQGFKQIWEYPNSSHRKFLDFMSNRTAVELFKTQMTLYIGEPQGPPTPGVFGMMPQPNVS